MSGDWQALFEETYASPASAVQERVWRSVLGAEYPDGLDPYSLVTRTELQAFGAELRVGEGDTLVDIGCGRGGAGLWIARLTGASLIGVDIAENALVDARARAAALGMAATFRRGEFEATGLPDGVADAVMSIDAFLFTPDKSAAFRELRRILRGGGRLVMTSWDYHRQPVGRPPQVPDHRPPAAAAGFEVVAYEETRDWRNRLERTGAGLLEAAEELAAETGSDADEVRAGLVQMNATVEAMTRRFFLVAEAR